MSEWIDFTVYVSEIWALWFLVPRWAISFTLPMITARNSQWVAENPVEIARISSSRGFRNANYVWGVLSAAVLLAIRLGVQPHWLLPVLLHKPGWEVLNTANNLLLILGLVGYATCLVLVIRWLGRTIPLGGQRTATLKPRSTVDSVPMGFVTLVYSITAAHLIAWLLVGVLGLNHRPQYWWGFAWALATSSLFIWMTQGVTRRSPSYLDHIFGATYRGAQVRLGLMLQLCLAALGALALCHEIWGLDSRRLSGLAVTLFLTFTILVFARLPDQRLSSGENGGSRALAALFILVLACVISMTRATPSRAQGISDTTPSAVRIDADLNAALVNRVDTSNKAVGIIVGILSPEGRRYLAHGLTRREGGRTPNADTVFEIGSMTKVFTALLLADMVERGEVRLDDQISHYLPADVKLPEHAGKAITLVDLVTHTSGLPRLPDNFDLTNTTNPYAQYGEKELYAFLSTYALPRDPGTQWEYSNLGAGLLGHILARRAGMTYEQLLRTRILEPLGMRNTTITLSAEQRGRLATGYETGMTGAPSSPWDWDVLAGAGAMRSTAGDMLTFAAATLGLTDHPLKAAMLRMLSVTRPANSPPIRQHLGWLEIGEKVLFHDGETGGYRCALAIRPGTRQAVVVLSNSTQDLSDIALHGVVPEQPMLTLAAAKQHHEIRLGEEILKTYVGTYNVTPQTSIVVIQEGDHLFAQANGQPRLELAAEGDNDFFDKTNGLLTFSFRKDGTGAVTQLAIHVGAADVIAHRRP